MDERYSHCFHPQAVWETGSYYQGRSSSHIPQPTGIGCFSQPHRFYGYAGEEQGRFQHQQLQDCQHGLSFHPHSHPHSHPLALAWRHDLQEAIYREMEKERIRQEIIKSEILRRRALEVEVRREMLMERELALGESNTVNFGSLSPVGLDLPMRLPLVETKPREERIVSLSQRNNLNNRSESDRSVPLPFQSASDDARVARNIEVKPIMEGVREKQKIILQAKPIQNATGAKRARSGSDASGSQLDGKKAKKELSCVLCQVSATSEESLNDHLKGKRHKMKEAELRPQKTSKNYTTGLARKTADKPIQGSGPVDPSIQSESKFTSESLPFSKSGDFARSATDPSQAKPIQNATGAKRARSGSDASGSQSDGKKAKKEMSCALCQVSATSEESLNDHLKGKRHKAKEAELRAQKTSKNYPKTAAKPIQGSRLVDSGTQSEMKFTSESLPFSKCGKIAIWCEICQISVSSQLIMDSHKTGKKHRRQLDKRNKCSGVGPSQKDAAVKYTMAEYVGATKKDEAVEYTMAEDAGATKKDEAVEYTMAEDAGATKKMRLWSIPWWKMLGLLRSP